MTVCEATRDEKERRHVINVVRRRDGSDEEMSAEGDCRRIVALRSGCLAERWETVLELSSECCGGAADRLSRIFGPSSHAPKVARQGRSAEGETGSTAPLRRTL